MLLSLYYTNIIQVDADDLYFADLHTHLALAGKRVIIIIIIIVIICRSPKG